jgi:lipid II:glycine glycyltransferase (peptidoglycan interpeptide bridge formation enzyme)
MITWRLLSADQREEWDRWILQSNSVSIFQAWGWGEFKRNDGWSPYRFSAHDKGGAVVAFAQLLVRRLPGGGSFVWVPGGPLSNSAAPVWLEPMANFHAGLEEVLGRCYVRCSLTTPRDGGEAYMLARSMATPLFKLNSGYTVFVDLTANDSDWLSSIDAKHRYYVRKSRAVGLTWKYGDDDGVLSVLAGLSSQMERDKGLLSQGMGLEDLRRLRTLLPGALRVLVGYLEGSPVTACLALRQGTNAFYMTAATVGRGREVSAAYAMLAELRTRLQNDQVKMLDFGGIDPVSKDARGVAHFKCGFGGRVVEYLGEWESGGLMARVLGNLAVAVKRH